MRSLFKIEKKEPAYKQLKWEDLKSQFQGLDYCLKLQDKYQIHKRLPLKEKEYRNYTKEQMIEVIFSLVPYFQKKLQKMAITNPDIDLKDFRTLLLLKPQDIFVNNSFKQNLSGLQFLNHWVQNEMFSIRAGTQKSFKENTQNPLWVLKVLYKLVKFFQFPVYPQ